MNNRSSLGFVSVLVLLAMMLLPVLGFSQTLSRSATVQRIAIHDGEKGPEVEITSSEPTLPQFRMLTAPDRVVIDFPGALPGQQLRSIAVNKGGMKRVRVSLFEADPPITRVVLDLVAPGVYQLFPTGNTVVVRAADTPEAVKARRVPTDPAPPLAPRVEGSSHDYNASANRVNVALRNLDAYSEGHLPMVEGFAGPDIEQLERYERPYYRYRVQVKAVDASHTTVSVVASLSAWFNDPNPSRSGYRSLPSSGRLEEDLLDRLRNALQVQETTLPPGSPTEQSTDPSSPRATEPAASPENKNTQHQELGYWVSQQEVRPFAGDWPRLKGKSVLFVFAHPRAVLSDVAPGQRRVLFLKRAFADSYRTAIHSPNPFQGVVVIFAGPRGAVAAATLTDIGEWMKGRLPDDALIKRCSLDPAAEFAQP